MSTALLVELQPPSPEELAFVDAHRERFEQAGWNPGVLAAALWLPRHPVMLWPSPAFAVLDGLRIEENEQALVLMREGRWSLVRLCRTGREALIL